jgi:hypothetical protein
MLFSITAHSTDLRFVLLSFYSAHSPLVCSHLCLTIIYKSGEIKPRHKRLSSSGSNDDESDGQGQLAKTRRGSMFPKRQPTPPMKVTEETMRNLGRVHYHLACLHGADRWPEIVQSDGVSVEDRPSHDIFSVVFHLCHAASLKNVPACLALARARIGLDSSV